MKVLVVYYTMYGHTLQLAQAAVEGARTLHGAEVLLRRAQEFDAVDKVIDENPFASQIRDQQKDIPICTVDDLREADALIFGSPTRYGNMCAQLKQLLDSTSSLWVNGEMEGKPVGLFATTASTHGGQETTLLTMMVPFLHLGMLIVGTPYSIPGLNHTEARGGTPYGATSITGGKGELQPHPVDLDIARALGKRVTEVGMKVRSPLPAMATV
ncbi:MAG: NAD(P)H:quinone oxidoreductase [Oculatellaceae cyanobacterium Prado106]|jgi:NAD(P)H dehydrogenase (quinone)|nr:NAD(P)H:quinone oxidoreductase [Oculatellaceae cyanobacterium Prado106]